MMEVVWRARFFQARMRRIEIKHFNFSECRKRAISSRSRDKNQPQRNRPSALEKLELIKLECGAPNVFYEFLAVICESGLIYPNLGYYNDSRTKRFQL